MRESINSPDNPRVSVITPSYNQGKYIEQTIRSVLSQDYPNLEYIIIDGGSQDETLQVIRKYENWLDYWESQPDKGQSHAINKGITRASGEIISWLNSDDVYLPGAVNSAVSRMVDSNAVIVYGRAKLTSSAGDFIKMYDPPERITLRGLLMMWQRDFALPAQPSVFMRRQVLEHIGELDESLDYVMDYELWLRAIQEFQFTYINEIWAEYRIHDESKTGRGLEPFIEEIMRIGKEYSPYLSKRDQILYRFYGKRALEGRYYLDQAYEAESRGDLRQTRRQLIRAFCSNPKAVIGNRGVMKFFLRAFSSQNM